MLVSIIMPLFDSERWLSETVRSVLDQTWRDWELLMVDDGSRDATVDIARGFESGRVKLLRQDNAGASAARNRALEVAQGEYLQFLDHDDLLAPEKIERQVARLAGSPNSVAACQWARFVTRPEEARFIREAVWRDLSPIDWIVTSAMGGGMMASSAWLIPRAVAERAGPWDASVRSPNDDGEYFNRVRLESDAVLFVEGARVFYRSGIGGYSGARSAVAVEALLHSLDATCDRVLAAENSPRTRRAMAANYARFVYDVYPDHPTCVRRAERRVLELGGTTLRPPMGGIFGTVSGVVGWRAARRLQRFAHRR